MAEPSKQELTNEIASVARDITIAVYGGILHNLDETLKTRGQGKGLAIYDDIERDCHAGAVIEKRKNAVVAREWEVDPASDSAIDTAAADLVRAQFKALNFDQLTKNLLDATLKGFAIGETMWRVDGAQLVVDRVIPRNQRRFAFAEDNALRLLTRESPMLGIALPERKFIVHTFGGKDGSPYGRGIGERLWWPTFFKRQDITFWLTFADKFGTPTAVGKYPSGASDTDQKKLLSAIGKIRNESAVIIPEGMLIELLEAARSGASDFYERLARYMDEQISEAVLGETMTTSAQGAGLGSGQAEVHNEVREEIAKGDADMLSETLNRTLVRWIVELNLPAATPPRVWRKFEEAEDLKSTVDRDKVLYDMGWEPTEERITEVYGEGYQRRTATPPVPPLGQAAFAEPGDSTNPADLLAAQLAERGADPLRVWIERVRSFAEEADSLEQLRDRLIAAYGDLPSEALSNIMALGFAAADLGGRLDVTEDSAGSA